jgi:hypothetical protein
MTPAKDERALRRTGKKEPVTKSVNLLAGVNPPWLMRLRKD